MWADYGTTGVVLDWLEGSITLEEARERLPWKQQATDKLLRAFEGLVKTLDSKDSAEPEHVMPEVTPPAPPPTKIWEYKEFVASLVNPKMGEPMVIKWVDENIPYPPEGSALTYKVGDHRVRCSVKGIGDGIIEVIPIAILSMETHI